jgi:phage FluMu gp28-like protein
MGLDEFLQQLAPIWKPHPGQRRFMEATEPTRMLACGRRWGKTAATAADIVYALQQPSPRRFLLVAPTGSQVLLLFDRVVDFLGRFCRLTQRITQRLTVRRSPFPRIEFEGSVVSARSGHRPQSLRGDEADYLVVDEAAFVSRPLIEETLLPMLATTDGRVTMLSTPNGFNHFFQWFRRGGRAGVWSQQSPSSENPWVKESFLARQREYLSDRAFAVEYEADFQDGEGQVFPEVHLDRAQSHPRPERPPGPFSIGIDWAETHDHTVVTVVAGTTEFCHVWETIWLSRMPYDQQLPRVLEILRRYPEAAVRCDATGVGRSPSDRIAGELPHVSVTQVQFTSLTKPAMIQWLRSLFERDAIGIGDNPRLREELRQLVSFAGPNGHTRYEAIRGYHDDAVMSLALAVGGLTSGGPRIHVL